MENENMEIIEEVMETGNEIVTTSGSNVYPGKYFSFLLVVFITSSSNFVHIITSCLL